MGEHKIVKQSGWSRRLVQNKKARERYHMKKYGNLDRLAEKERKFNEKWDTDNWVDEYKNPSIEINDEV